MTLEAKNLLEALEVWVQGMVVLFLPSYNGGDAVSLAVVEAAAFLLPDIQVQAEVGPCGVSFSEATWLDEILILPSVADTIWQAVDDVH